MFAVYLVRGGEDDFTGRKKYLVVVGLDFKAEPNRAIARDSPQKRWEALPAAFPPQLRGPDGIAPGDAGIAKAVNYSWIIWI